MESDGDRGFLQTLPRDLSHPAPQGDRQGPRSVSDELFRSWLLLLYLSNSTNIHEYWDGNAPQGDIN